VELQLLARRPMDLLFGLALSASLFGPSRPIPTVEPDSSSAIQRLTPEEALFLLQSEHHFSFPMLLLEDPATPTR
jgi:hypothetical protein